MLLNVELTNIHSVFLVLLSSLFILILVYTITHSFYNLCLHPLSKFPGPKLWALSRIPRERAAVLGRIPYAIRDLHAKYGPIVRTAPDELAFVSSLALKDIYTRHGVSKKLLPKDPITYQIPPGGVPCILTALDDDEHTRIRRLVWHAFSEKALQEQSPLIKRYVDLLIFRLKENAAKEEQDLVRWYTFTAFDIIGDLTLGEGFQCLEKSDYHPWVGFLFRAFKMSGFISGAARFPLIGQYLLMLLPKSIVKARMEHAAFTREKVLKRMQLGTERSDFMSNILKNNEEGTGMTVDEIVATFYTILIAGSETTSTLLSAATFYLLKNQDMMSKLVKEIRSSFQTEDEITQISVNKLTYLIAVLNETMRIHPPTPQGGPRIIPSDGQMVDGHWVPGGTIVWVPTYSANHQASNWKDPDSFVPDRFLNDPQYSSDDKASFAPFSVGPRNCIGMNLAYAEMRLVLTRMLWNFDLELGERSRHWVDGMKMYTLWEKPPLYVKLKPAVRND